MYDKTRLIGVVAMKIMDGSRDKLFQLIHLDFSELRRSYREAILKY